MTPPPTGVCRRQTVSVQQINLPMAGWKRAFGSPVGGGVTHRLSTVLLIACLLIGQATAFAAHRCPSGAAATIMKADACCCHSSGADSACRMHCAEAQEAVRLSAAVPSSTHRLTAFPSDIVSGLPASHVVSTGRGNLHLSPLSCTPHDPPEAFYLTNCTFRL